MIINISTLNKNYAYIFAEFTHSAKRCKNDGIHNKFLLFNNFN